MTDIDLIDANILWTPAETPGHPYAGTMCVEHRQETNETTLYYKHRTKLGACMMWSKETQDERLLQLLQMAVCMMARDGLESTAVHKGLSRIPEYRRFMAYKFEEFEAERLAEVDEG